MKAQLIIACLAAMSQAVSVKLAAEAKPAGVSDIDWEIFEY